MVTENRARSRFVKIALSGHSGLGLALSALLYIVVFSGTVAVFYPEFERWEQPVVEEFTEWQPGAISRAVNAIMEREALRTDEPPDHLFIALPYADMPRFAVYAGETGAFADPSGRLGEPVNHEWTHFLTNLHLRLTLPSVWGLTLVGVLGVGLAALVIGSILAHPNLIKDAFSLRWSGSARLRLADVHNRLGVWSSPFALALAITGAVIGLSQVLGFVVATLFFEGDTDAATASLFLPDPKPTGEAAPLANVSVALETVRAISPEMKPNMIIVHEPGTTAQQTEVGALVPGRLVWSEFYALDAEGQLLESAGWSDGEPGVQIYASIFRLHFGHFGGLPVQLLYLLLGAGLCVCVAAGCNIWLLRQRQRGMPYPRLEGVWVAVVWGTPLVLTLSTIGWLGLGWEPIYIFWGGLLLSLVASAAGGDRACLAVGFKALLAVALVLLSLHAALFGLDSIGPAARLINGLLLISVLLVSLRVWLEIRWISHGMPTHLSERSSR
ncbi:PepSY-associated TM helix domain-containing protein [Porticoccus sp.]|uniref:PepSY-associated TM helix domain-containing protein n=1 Tax=Porticoccus sp. TaxID=2024853 RepID=UPI003F69B134